MKKLQYIEGSRAMENFEEGMKALFKVPKDAVVKAEKKLAHHHTAGCANIRKFMHMQDLPKLSDHCTYSPVHESVPAGTLWKSTRERA